MGLDIATVNNMLSTIFAGRDVNDFTLNGELKPVFVQGDAPYRMQESAINDWHARNANGEMVPFSSFVRRSGSVVRRPSAASTAWARSRWKVRLALA